jgi:hypothetical protein
MARRARVTPLRLEAKMIRLPSGDQIGAKAKEEPNVNCVLVSPCFGGIFVAYSL